MQLGFGQVTTPTIVSGRSTGRFSCTLKSRMMEIVAVGAIRAIAFTFRGELHVLDLHDVLPPELARPDVDTHRDRRIPVQPPGADDAKHVDGQPVADVVDDGPILDGGDAEFAHRGHSVPFVRARIASKRAIRTGTPRKA